MPKKRVKKGSKRGIKYHITHKSRLTSLLAIKILLAFLCFGLGIIAYFFINGIFNQVISLILSFVVAIVLYLFLFLRVLNQFKFQ
ncbi:hypothetical protein J4422_00275 [Candidatus Pacearchaeota archaeon]|nr:hypothetical protein [Candidatus Pacearchaeota archaeon]